MKVLVVYDSVSAQKLTTKVAESIGQALREGGLQVDTLSVKDADPAAVNDHDCLIVGSPTMAWKPTSETMKFLESLPDNGFIGKSAAAFDTQIKSMISGNATKAMEARLVQLGFRIPTPALLAYVEGKTSNMRLKDGELEKARNWAKGLAKSVGDGTKA